MNKPWYTLRIEAGGCPYDVRINDCPVYAEPNGFPLTAEFPINQWIFNGQNQISVKLQRSESGAGRCSAEIRLKEFDEKDVEPVTVAKLEVETEAGTGLDNPEKSINNDDEIEKSEGFIAKVPFSEWRWLVNEPIPLSVADREEITNLAKKYWQALKDNDMDIIGSLLEGKIEDISQAYYQSPENTKESFIAEFKDLIDDPDMHVDAFYDTELEFNPYAGGRLILLIDGATGESPVLFTDQEETIGTYLKLYFCRDAQGAWKIIR